MLLIMEGAMIGVFSALDFVLFYVFWEAMLIPMYLLIGVWGGPNRLYAAIKFFLYTLTGSVLLLVAILVLYFQGGHTFDILQLSQGTYSKSLQFWLFLAFFAAFAVKVPMFPFHTWLPDAHVEAPTAGSVLLASVLLKMGTYGFVRFSLPMLPDASQAFTPLMVVLSIIAIIYGAYMALAQADLKKLIAYSSVSHMGFVTLGLFMFNIQGIEGAVMQMVQSRHHDRGALSLRGDDLRTHPQPTDRRQYRTDQTDATVCDVPGHFCIVFVGIARHQQFCRGVYGSDRHLPLEQDRHSLRLIGNHPRRRLLALDGSTCRVRRARLRTCFRNSVMSTCARW